MDKYKQTWNEPNDPGNSLAPLTNEFIKLTGSLIFSLHQTAFWQSLPLDFINNSIHDVAPTDLAKSVSKDKWKKKLWSQGSVWVADFARLVSESTTYTMLVWSATVTISLDWGFFIYCTDINIKRMEPFVLEKPWSWCWCSVICWLKFTFIIQAALWKIKTKIKIKRRIFFFQWHNLQTTVFFKCLHQELLKIHFMKLDSHQRFSPDCHSYMHTINLTILAKHTHNTDFL